MAAPLNLDDLRRHAVARTLWRPTSLPRAIERLGFVQADPIRAPARAQDLTLRHRVRDYRAGDLERRYPRLALEEDYFVNYGFLPRAHQALMHPRRPARPWSAVDQRRAARVLEVVRESGSVHPKDLQRHFALGRSRNDWGGTSNTPTLLLDRMHHRGWLRVARREAGQRVYAEARHAHDMRSDAQKAEALLALVLAKYGPLPVRSLGPLCSALRYGAPHLQPEVRQARHRLLSQGPRAVVDGHDWIWPAGEDPRARRWALDDEVRLLAPFDPIVWDRHRFELLWGWAYRFEAYTPAARRRWGYYALPLLWRGGVIGWCNVGRGDTAANFDFGYLAGRAPRDAAFRRALDAEVARFEGFLDAGPTAS
jgi:uncharacterized protein YcaQ